MKRFSFGKNWMAYSRGLTTANLDYAKESLQIMLDREHLQHTTFLDVGCGSGIFSLAACQLGASVRSFDYDAYSVRCTNEIKERFARESNSWNIFQGSILDDDFLRTLGTFDIVYSWGVLHHTGNMWQSCENISSLVSKDGILFIALYNDQGFKSSFWKIVKKIYCSGAPGRGIMKAIFVPAFFLGTTLSCLRKGVSPVKYFKSYAERRGMSPYYDWLDWLGGYPFECATFDEVSNFFKHRGFTLIRSTSTNGLGCNQFVFKRS